MWSCVGLEGQIVFDLDGQSYAEFVKYVENLVHLIVLLLPGDDLLPHCLLGPLQLGGPPHLENNGTFNFSVFFAT